MSGAHIDESQICRPDPSTLGGSKTHGGEAPASAIAQEMQWFALPVVGQGLLHGSVGPRPESLEPTVGNEGIGDLDAGGAHLVDESQVAGIDLLGPTPDGDEQRKRFLHANRRIHTYSREPSAPSAVLGPCADRVLVESLGEVQTLEDEFDRTGHDLGRRVATGERSDMGGQRRDVGE